MRRLSLIVLGVGIGVSGALTYACVGDDATPSGGGGTDAGGSTDAPSGQDAGDTGAPPVDGGSDAGSPTCRGQKFDAPKQLDTSQVSAALAGNVVWGPRLSEANAQVNGDAYFSAWPNGATEQQLFRATFVAPAGGSPPQLKNAQELTPPSSTTVVEWSPILAFGGGSPASPLYMVYAEGLGSRNLMLATVMGGGAGFTAGTTIAALSTARDEADPWLVGRPPTAMYFGQENEDAPSHMRIARSSITGTAPPVFEAPKPKTFICPDFHCGTPVTSRDEQIFLFGAWPAGGGFVPKVGEIVAGADGGEATMLHDELGTAYPSWISDDGCEVLLGATGIPTASDLLYARRTPK